MNFEIAPKSTEIEANWNDATFYCFALNIDGKSGWRLPTSDELNWIWESANDFVEWYYWSSTEYNSNHVCGQSFDSGRQNNTNKNCVGVFVRAVRDLT